MTIDSAIENSLRVDTGGLMWITLAEYLRKDLRFQTVMGLAFTYARVFQPYLRAVRQEVYDDCWF